MRLLKNIIIILVLISFVHGCGSKKDQVSDDVKLATIKGNTFNYKTTENATEKFIISWNNEPLPNTVVFFYLNEVGDKGVFIGKTVSNALGQVFMNFNVPSSHTTLYYKYEFLGNTYSGEVSLKRESVAQATQKKRSLFSNIINGIIPSVNAAEVQTCFNGQYENKINYLSDSYDENGVPSNLIKDFEVLNMGLLERISISLPENKPVPTYHPEFIESGAYSNIIVEQEADIWITYLAEGAGFKNTLGFFSYKSDEIPSNLDTINQFNIIFPNVSNKHSGGELEPGDTVYLGRFEANTTISFFLISNGWDSNSKCNRYHNSSNNFLYTSIDDLNPEGTSELRSHNVLFYDEEEEKIVIGFEDLRRDYSSDDDFNDAIFYVTSNPIESIDISKIAPIDKAVDTDNDGIDDELDDYPNDPRKAFANYYPSKNQRGTLMFEDLWPSLGDYDFNDLVLYYDFVYDTDSKSNVVTIKANFSIIATGAGQSNGFALRLPIPAGKVVSVTGQEIYGDSIKLLNSGIEEGQDEAVIIVTDNVNEVFPKFGNIYNGFSNSPHNLSITIELEDNVHLTQTGLPPFDPFIIKDGNREIEIHQMIYGPTLLGLHNLFGKYDDESDLARGLFYRTTDYLPWVLDIPHEIYYPKEKVPLYNAYSKFMIWASSGGAYYSDWYMEKDDYIDMNKVINTREIRSERLE